MTRKGNNHSLQINLRHHKEKTPKLDIHHTIQVKQLAVSQQEFRCHPRFMDSLSLPPFLLF